VYSQVASYLRFVIDYWDTLPEFAAFVHGHDVSWHQMGFSMQYMLRNLCFEHVSRRRHVAAPTTPHPHDPHTSAPAAGGVKEFYFKRG
jgi:hypothetical protein